MSDTGTRRREAAADATRAKRRPEIAWLLCLLLSFVVRAGAGWLVVGAEVPLIYDEGPYFHRAVAFEKIIDSLLEGETPHRGQLHRAYFRGVWPPAHPLALGIGMAVAGPTVGAARATVVVLGSLTTLVVYFLTRRIAGRRAALWAAVIHAVHPSFIFFSHYLFSETTYLFFLLLAVAATLTLPTATSSVRRSLLAAAAGGCIALAALSRTAALPFLAILPVWPVLVLKGVRARVVYPCIMAAVMVATLAPWQSVLKQREGRFVLLSTVTGYYLLSDNDPWQTDSGPRLKARLAEYAQAHQLEPEAAARKLLLEQARQHPVEFLGRMIKRVRLLWTVDNDALRHLLSVVYPPLPLAAAWSIVLLLVASYLGFVGLSCLGLLARGPRASDKVLLLVAGAASMLSPALTWSDPRMSHPILALLLPLAGHGLATLVGGARRRHLAVTGGLVALIAVNVATLPRIAYFSSQSSAYYRSVLARVDGMLGSQSELGDCIVLRTDRDLGKVKVLLEEGYELIPQRRRGIVWRTGPGNREIRLNVVSLPQPRPLTLTLRVRGTRKKVQVRPLEPESWRKWKKTDLAGVSVQWCGGPPLKCDVVE